MESAGEAFWSTLLPAVATAPLPTPTFASYFRLKDGARRNFKLDPERDSGLYVDLDGAVDRLRRALEEEAPKVAIEGDFGTGKTHALQFVASLARGDRVRPRVPIVLSLSGFGHNTGFVEGVHRGVFEKLVALFLRDGKRYEAMLSTTGLLGDLPVAAQRALRQLQSPTPAEADAARAWLCASRTLTPSKALKAGYSALLAEVMQPSDLARLYVALAHAWRDQTGEELLLLLDEGEAFSRVQSEDAQASIGGGLRPLFDNTNRALGLFLGVNTPRARKGTHPMLRSDVRSRVTTHVLLPTLQSLPLRERFVDLLWRKLAADPTSRPFMLDSDARRFIIDEVDALRQRLLRDQQLASPTPRDLLNVLDLIAQIAWRAEAQLPLTEIDLRRWTGVARESVNAG